MRRQMHRRRCVFVVVLLLGLLLLLAHLLVKQASERNGEKEAAKTTQHRASLSFSLFVRHDLFFSSSFKKNCVFFSFSRLSLSSSFVLSHFSLYFSPLSSISYFFFFAAIDEFSKTARALTLALA